MWQRSKLFPSFCSEQRLSEPDGCRHQGVAEEGWADHANLSGPALPPTGSATGRCQTLPWYFLHSQCRHLKSDLFEHNVLLHHPYIYNHFSGYKILKPATSCDCVSGSDNGIWLCWLVCLSNVETTLEKVHGTFKFSVHFISSLSVTVVQH